MFVVWFHHFWCGSLSSVRPDVTILVDWATPSYFLNCARICVCVMRGFSIIWMSLIRTIFPPCSHNSYTQLMQCISHKREVYY